VADCVLGHGLSHKELNSADLQELNSADLTTKGSREWYTCQVQQRRVCRITTVEQCDTTELYKTKKLSGDEVQSIMTSSAAAK
jgi:hypothetical protein